MSLVTIQNTLPDPSNKYGPAGDEATGPVGVGFRSVKLTSEQKIVRGRTNSGRLVQNIASGHMWKIEIDYNPMTREEFNVINNFLSIRRNTLQPFYVSLPQYKHPQNADFKTFISDANNAANIQSPVGQDAGVRHLSVNGMPTNSDHSPQPGDLFTISNNDSLHTKVYQVLRVDSADAYSTSGVVPSASTRLIHFHPPLIRDIAANDVINFNDPKFRVVAPKAAQSYNLNTDNLYQFSLQLEEAQP